MGAEPRGGRFGEREGGSPDGPPPDRTATSRRTFLVRVHGGSSCPVLEDVRTGESVRLDGLSEIEGQILLWLAAPAQERERSR